jgi:hypothetical protein
LSIAGTIAQCDAILSALHINPSCLLCINCDLFDEIFANCQTTCLYASEFLQREPDRGPVRDLHVYTLFNSHSISIRCWNITPEISSKQRTSRLRFDPPALDLQLTRVDSVFKDNKIGINLIKDVLPSLPLGDISHVLLSLEIDEIWNYHDLLAKYKAVTNLQTGSRSAYVRQLFTQLAVSPCQPALQMRSENIPIRESDPHANPCQLFSQLPSSPYLLAPQRGCKDTHKTPHFPRFNPSIFPGNPFERFQIRPQSTLEYLHGLGGPLPQVTTLLLPMLSSIVLDNDTNTEPHSNLWSEGPEESEEYPWRRLMEDICEILRQRHAAGYAVEKLVLIQWMVPRVWLARLRSYMKEVVTGL